MAAKFVVIALAFCSASANVCMPILAPKDGCHSFPEVFSAPAVAPAGPGFISGPAIPVSAPRFVSAPAIAPSFGFPQDFSEPAPEIGSGSFSSGSVRNIPVIQAPSVTLKPVESPIITLPSPVIPGPQVIRHKCFCTKTVVRPQIIQRTITVPRIQRYLKRSYRPVVENVAYTAKPIGGESQGQEIVIGGGAGAPVSGPVSFVPGGVISGGVVSGGVVPSGAIPSGVIPSGVIPSGVISGGVIPAGVLSGGVISGGPVVEASETTCEQVVPSFPRCY